MNAWYDVSQWRVFASAMSEVSASLTGLLFVAMSLRAKEFGSGGSREETFRKQAAQALVLLGVPCISALMVLIPGQTSRILGFQYILLAVLMAAVLLRLQRAVRRATTLGDRLLRALDYATPRILCTLTMTAGGISLVAGRLGGFLWILTSQIICAIAGVTTAWLFLTHPVRDWSGTVGPGPSDSGPE